MFDNAVTAATFTSRADGTFLVRVELKVRKLRVDGDGTERPIPVDDWIDIAVLGEGGEGEGNDGDGGTVLFEGRRRIRVSPEVFEIAVDERPVRVAIDPYYKLIDRNRNDNVRAVSSSSDDAGR